MTTHHVEAAVERMSAVLVIVDPLMAYLSAFINSHKDTDCRHALWPLAKLAEETGAAVLVVRHLNKRYASNPLYHGALRIAWTGPNTHTADSLLAVPRDDEERDAAAHRRRWFPRIGLRPAEVDCQVANK
jgi:hypothetical protein